jgi:dCMP deaminase
VITSPDYRQISTGYNGFPRGFPDTIENWRTKENKYKYVIHSELNNLLNCPFDTKGCYLYCTTQPCVECMKALIQAGISRIFYINEYDKIDIEAWNNLVLMFDLVVRYLT